VGAGNLLDNCCLCVCVCVEDWSSEEDLLRRLAGRLPASVEVW
jgi:hypothetical protein